MYLVLLLSISHLHLSFVDCEFIISKFGRNIVTTSLGKFRGVQVDLQYASNFTLQDVDSFRGIEWVNGQRIIPLHAFKGHLYILGLSP